MFDSSRGLYFTLGVVAAILLTAGALLLVARRDSWRPVMAGGAAVSLVQLLVFFEPGQFIGIGIDVAILAVIVWTYRQHAGQPTPAGVGSAEGRTPRQSA